jgi:hypothetical protein
MDANFKKPQIIQCLKLIMKQSTFNNEFCLSADLQGCAFMGIPLLFAYAEVSPE